MNKKIVIIISLITIIILVGIIVWGYLLFKPCEHQWQDANCEKSVTCKLCGEVAGNPLGHNWKDANCTDAKTCLACGITEGEPLGHNWKDANCTDAKKCSVCGTTEGEPLGHNWKSATYSSPKTCVVCGTTEGMALNKPNNNSNNKPTANNTNINVSNTNSINTSNNTDNNQSENKNESVKNFTVTLANKKGLTIYETLSTKNTKTFLKSNDIKTFTDISVMWLPENIDDEGDGSHNGRNYIAYTFFAENMGQSTMNYGATIKIDDVVQNMDEAIRVMVIKNGKKVIYAKNNKNTGNPEPNTIPFYDKDTVMMEKIENFKVGDIDKYTVVIWVEGDDPECKNEVINGDIKIHMTLT